MATTHVDWSGKARRLTNGTDSRSEDRRHSRHYMNRRGSPTSPLSTRAPVAPGREPSCRFTESLISNDQPCDGRVKTFRPLTSNRVSLQRFDSCWRIEGSRHAIATRGLEDSTGKNRSGGSAEHDVRVVRAAIRVRVVARRVLVQRDHVGRCHQVDAAFEVFRVPLSRMPHEVPGKG